MTSSTPPMSDHDADLLREKQFEDEIMGETNRQANNNFQKSIATEKNLNQMVKVLKARLKGLEDAATTRLKLCDEDLDATSTRMSKQAPKIVDEFDEVIPRSLRDTKASSNNTITNANIPAGTNTMSHGKENLVSSDTIFIDPYHLVVRTKLQTETAKKLENVLEDSFGNVYLRDMKNKKNKNLNSSDKTKRTEQLKNKNEEKRLNRVKIEKKLQMNMENFVTRSVMDSELLFHLPATLSTEANWPVSIKWCSRDSRSVLVENHEGEFDPDLLLRYALEKMNLPSGKKLFTWLMKQAMIQRYFVSLFWIIKIKFFESDSPIQKDVEAYLLRLLAIEYRCLLELLGNRTHAEHEKDFVFKYLPFIFTNGVYFGFYYVFPGSRHIYTKGFKKTIYMQIIQVMHGFQVCPISVKVSWGKLFPEDVHDETTATATTSTSTTNTNSNSNTTANGTNGTTSANSNGNVVIEDGAEVFPVQLAFKSIPPLPLPNLFSRRKSTTTLLPHNNHDNSLNRPHSTGTNNSHNNSHNGNGIAMVGVGSPNSNSYTSNTNTNTTLGIGIGGTIGGKGMLVNDNDLLLSSSPGIGIGGGHSGHSITSNSIGNSIGSIGSNNSNNSNSIVNNHHNHHHNNHNHNHVTYGTNNTNTNNTNNSNNHNTSNHSITSTSHTTHTTTTNTTTNTTNPYTNTNNTTKQSHLLDTHTFATSIQTLQPLSKTYLTPLLEKPSNIRNNNLLKRQSNVERVNTNSLSPSMTLFLTAMNGKKKQTSQVPLPLPGTSDGTHGNGNESLNGSNVTTGGGAAGGAVEEVLQQEKQTFRRTIPVSWAPAGGSDTHRKRIIATDLHNTIANQLKQSQSDYYHETYYSHHQQIKTVKENAKTLEKILNSGPTNISRYSLDLIRRQRNLRPNGTSSSGNGNGGNGTNGNGNSNTGNSSSHNNTDITPPPPQPMEEIDWNEMQQLAQYDDDEIERFLEDF